jgi:beta-lactamase superfamily II metal-dependent hydrolase
MMSCELSGNLPGPEARSGTEPRWLVVLAVWLSSLLPACASSQKPAGIEITFLDVGQADAVLIREPQGRAALVDAGESAPLGALASLGVQRLDLLVASHPHADHIGGMVRVIEAIPIRYFMDNGQPHTTETYRNLIRTLQLRSDIIYLAAEPRSIQLGAAQIDVLPLPPPGEDDHNNRSVGLVVRYGAFVVLLTGDSELSQLSHLLQSGSLPDVTVLKAPHHGADNGITREFLQATRPEVVVISVGANSYGHPGQGAVAAYSSFAEELYRTDVHGAVTIVGFEDGRYEARTDGAPSWPTAAAQGPGFPSTAAGRVAAGGTHD